MLLVHMYSIVGVVQVQFFRYLEPPPPSERTLFAQICRVDAD